MGYESSDGRRRIMTKIATITLNDGVGIPQLGFGTAPMSDDVAEASVATALEVGYRHIDTAAAYGNETGIGKALAASGLPRDQVFVTTKLDSPEHKQGDARSGLEASLERLGLDHVDLYLIHWPLPKTGRFVQIWEQFLQLRSEGLTRSIGVSNFLPQHLDALQDETGITPSVNQFELHPTHQEEELINYCHDAEIAVEAYAPLGNATDLDARVIQDIARESQATPAQVILAWHLHRGFIAIPKSSTAARIQENFDAAWLKLSSSQLSAIDGMHTGSNKVWGDPLEVN